jgi:hypothetical protein
MATVGALKAGNGNAEGLNLTRAVVREGIQDMNSRYELYLEFKIRIIFGIQDTNYIWNSRYELYWKLLFKIILLKRKDAVKIIQDVTVNMKIIQDVMKVVHDIRIKRPFEANVIHKNENEVYFYYPSSVPAVWMRLRPTFLTMTILVTLSGASSQNTAC